MKRKIKFKHNKKDYEILNDWKPITESKLFTEKIQDAIHIGIIKEQISRCNRSKARKKYLQKKKVEQFAAPKEIKEIDFNVGLFRNLKNRNKNK